eukprot:7484561-Pyramimonas_sp.AAC.3
MSAARESRRHSRGNVSPTYLCTSLKQVTRITCYNLLAFSVLPRTLYVSSELTTVEASCYVAQV